MEPHFGRFTNNSVPFQRLASQVSLLEVSLGVPYHVTSYRIVSYMVYALKLTEKRQTILHATIFKPACHSQVSCEK
jgi:hypothetical protein